jgi:murein DD-endopeptidase MepM/ murein hydrolase activator NlpD
MKKMRHWIGKAFSSVTIMVIPHDHVRTLNLKIPIALLCLTIMLAGVGGGYLLNLAVTGIHYRAQHYAMVAKVRYYSDQFYQWGSTVVALKGIENQFRNLFSLGSKEQVLEQADNSFVGSLDLPDLVRELKKTTQNVEGIRSYLHTQKNLFIATPRGLPVSGNISSYYGRREDPVEGGMEFHSGLDISCGMRTPIHATADGVVSHSGWANGSGQVVVLEHGCGFSTIYAHNSANVVKLGQKVRKGDIIAYVGMTGKTTGPHVHYEIWKDGRNINPQPYLSEQAKSLSAN